MSIRKVQSKHGQTKWIVRVYTNGRGSQRIKRTFLKRADAEIFYRNFSRELLERKTNPFRDVAFETRTFKTEAENWLRGAEIRFSPGSFLKASVIVRDLLPSYGEIPIDRFTAEVVSKFQHEEKKKGLTDATVNRKCQVVMAILNHAVKQRRIPYNPAVGFMKLKEAQKDARYWSREEAASFLSFANSKYSRESDKRWIYAVYLLALNTALRSGEIWGLKAEDLSPFSNVITVRRQLNQVSGELAPTKSRRGRMVPCSVELATELKTLMTKKAKADDGATLFRNERGGPIDHKNFYHRVYIPDIESWGGKYIRFHDLRHTATTLMIASGVDIRTVKEICGHADIETTMNYVHLVASSVEKVPELFSLSPTSTD